MELNYKNVANINRQIIGRASALITSEHINPFNTTLQVDCFPEISDDDFKEVSNIAPNAFQCICSGEILLQHLTVIGKYVSAPQFSFSNNTQFFNQHFVNGLITSLLSGQDDFVCEKALYIISHLWFHHPKDFSILTNVDFLRLLFDILNGHTNQEMRHLALFAMNNFLRIGPPMRDMMVKEDIFFMIRNFLSDSYSPHQYETGLRALYSLVENGIDDIWPQLLQIIPVYKLMLRNPAPQNREKALWTLSLIIENEKIFERCRILEIHSYLAECVVSILNPRYASYVFICIFTFVKRNFLRAFSNESFFNGIDCVLLQNETGNISSIFFTISLMIDKYGKRFYEHKTIEHCIKYANTGIFANKISASFCVAKLLLDFPPDICDIYAREGGLEALCAMLECFSDADAIVALRAIQKLVEMNEKCFSNLIREFSAEDGIEEISNRALERLRDEPGNAMWRETAALASIVLQKVRGKCENQDI